MDRGLSFMAVEECAEIEAGIYILSTDSIMLSGLMINMADEKLSRNTIFVAPTNVIKVVGTKGNSFGLSEDEKSVLMFVRNHGGIVPEARVKSESGVDDGTEACIEKLVGYDYVTKDKNKIILTNNGEYVAQFFRMKTIKYK